MGQVTILDTVIGDTIDEINTILSQTEQTKFRAVMVYENINEKNDLYWYYEPEKQKQKIDNGSKYEVLQFLRGYLLALKEFNIGK